MDLCCDISKVLPTLFPLLLLTSSSVQQDLCSTTCLRTNEAFHGSTSPINPQINTTMHQGPRGKAGPRGIQGADGAKGEKGEPGRVDNEELRAVIETVEALRERIEGLEQRERVLTTTTTTTTTTTPAATTTTNKNGGRETESCDGGVIYNNQCIILPYTSNPAGYNTSFNEGVEICRRNSYQVAEITSDEMYDSVAAYLRRTWNFGSVTYVDLWLASTYATKNNPSHLITLTNGRRITSTRWHPGYPMSSDSSRTQIAWQLLKNENDSHGIFNYNPGSNLHAPLCAYNIE